MRLRTKILTALLLLLAFYTNSSAQIMKATAKLDSSKILIGDQVKMHLQINHPKNVKVDFPVYTENLTNNIEVIEALGVDTLKSDKKDNIIKELQAYLITSFDSGSYRIPPQWIKVKINGKIDSIPTNGVDLQVLTMKIDTTRSITDIKMPYKAPLTLKEITPYILGVIVVLAIIFFIFYYLRRRKKGDNTPILFRPKRQKEPAHIIALRALNAIKSGDLIAKGKIKMYYSQVTDTVRTYIEDRFEMPAMEQTTDEIYQSFQSKKGLISEQETNQLNSWLQLADLVKFAKHKPTVSDNTAILDYAFHFVNSTKVVEQPKDNTVTNKNNVKSEEV